MTSASKDIGSVENPTGVERVVSIPGAILVLGAAAVAAYIGFKIGGPVGSAVGTLVGAFVGALGAGYIKRFKVILHGDGTIEVEYETRF
jgi:hypothetical protein